MSVLKGFLQPSPMEATTEVIISERFKGEDGKPLPFKIRKIDQDTANQLLKKCRVSKKVNGQVIEVTDNAKYSNLLILACVLEPNFRDKEMCDYYKVIDPAEIPGRMLSLGEYGRLSEEIMRFCDFDTPEGIEEEAKN
ncbi:MAG: hypothetical protein IKF39_02045 [Oscillospiraceae bacterium]|nr:hypothetical protein [Oscillospiraceae bacterium]